MDPAPSLTTGEAAGAQIGRYRLLERIGEGGMGTIWMAEQREPVRRRVALKIIKLGMDTKQVVARFEVERQALALMDHPHIAKVLDAGSTETGRPYFVMEYIKGIPILDYCDQEKLDTKARLELFTSVCHAIQHAHHKGIIHRDIKPSNVLVSLHDGVPVPKVIDFGIAKATNSELTSKTLFTEHRQMIGTPAYMSPEQAEMSGLDIDTRSDVYSLGVLLYELLTGTTPFDTKALLESGFDEMLRAIREVEPHKPSTRVSKLGDTGTRTAWHRRAEPKKLSLLLRGDIDWIVMKCLEKDRTRRYETANGLASDLQRHLRDEPVNAGPPSSTYRLRKFVRRNRLKVVASTIVLVALLAAVVSASWGLVQASQVRSAELERQVQEEHDSSARKARLSRNAEAVAALLGQCEEALRDGDASKAKVALDAARERFDDGGADAEAERLERRAADLDLSTELDAIDQYRWTWVGNGFGDEGVAATRMREALGDFGADPDFASVEEAAARANSSAIRERIVLTLNRLFLIQHDAKGRAEALSAVLRQVDADPFRDAFRDAVVAHDQLKVLAFARDPALLQQSPEFIAALGQSQAIPELRRRELLQAALIRKPSDLALLMTMQSLPSINTEEATAERLRWLQAAIAADPQCAAAYVNLGSALHQKGQEEKRIACCRKAIEIDPGAWLAYNNLGAALNSVGRFAEGLPFLRKAVALEPTAAFAQSNLGETLAALGQWDEAFATYRKALELDPNDGYVHAVLGDAFRLNGRMDEAIASYRKSVELDPKQGKPRIFLGEALEQQGRTDEAIECMRDAVVLEPKAAWVRAKLGDALRKAGKQDEAIACYRKAIELDPTYNAYGCLGEALKHQGQWAESIACSRKAIELEPQNPGGHMNLSEALRMNGQTAEAVAPARKAVELAPTNARVYVALGLALHAEHQQDAAIASFRKAIELDPDNSPAHQNLGVALHETGHDPEALESYTRAAKSDPENVKLQMNLAMTLQSLGDHDGALAGFQRVLELDPDFANAAYNVGVELGATGRYEEAIAAYQRTLELNPDFAEASCNLGMALQNLDRFEEAVPYIRRGHELGSQRADWRYASAEWLRQVELRAELAPLVPDLLAGVIAPLDEQERLAYAVICGVKGWHRRAAALYAEAFAAEPALADDVALQRRYEAAGDAALATTAREKESAQIDDAEKARLRKQALDWLRADLAFYTGKLATNDPDQRGAIRRRLGDWQRAIAFAGIRDPAALALLPPDERDAFRLLWIDVAALVK